MSWGAASIAASQQTSKQTRGPGEERAGALIRAAQIGKDHDDDSSKSVNLQALTYLII